MNVVFKLRSGKSIGFFTGFKLHMLRCFAETIPESSLNSWANKNNFKLVNIFSEANQSRVQQYAEPFSYNF